SPSSPVACVADGGSFLVSNAIEPGELLTIFGNGLGDDPLTAYDESQQLPFASNGAEVRIGGYRAPLLAVSSRQINAVVPYEVAPPYATAATIEVYRNSQLIYSWPLAVTVRNPAPLLSFD